MASPADTTMTSRYASRQLNKLCNGCQAVFPTEGPWFWDREGARTTDQGEWILRDFTICDLHESAEAGCHLCRVFLDSLLPPDMIVGRRQGYHKWYDKNEEAQIRCTLGKRWDGEQFPMKLKVFKRRGRQNILVKMVQPLRFQPVRLTLLEKGSDRTTWVTDLRFDSWRDPSLSGRPFTIAQPPSATSFNASSFAQVRRWLTECLESHGECSNWKSTLMETYDYQRKIRLVDVGAKECPVLRLVDGESLISGTGSIEYVTLSYRWTAETEVTSLKSYNKASYQDLIPTDTLPLVYMDAAAVARALGVRYVWIDSLCIIQDSPEDWNEQSSLMDRIYTHGVLNLSAMFAERALGLQIERDPLGVSPCILSRRLPTNPEKGEELYEHWVCFEGYGANSFVDLAPLFKRAWCYQERVLPIRTVYFGEQLIWQCQRSMASESFPSWICRESSDSWRETYVYAQRQHTSIGRFPFADAYTAAKRPEEIWEELVNLYSKAKVTKQTDRLVALRGILNRVAGFFEELEPDWCIAGLWKASLVKQLLWQRDDKIDKRDSQMIACSKEIFELFPSWSWASCATEISFQKANYPGDPSHVDMIQVESIQPDQPLSPGATYTAFETSSRIVMRGLLDAKFKTAVIVRNWATDDKMHGLEVLMSYDNERTIKFNTGIVFDRPMPDSTKHQDLRLLPIRLYCQVNDNCSGWVAGLLVESLGVREGVPTYRRMGMFSAYCEREIITGWFGRVEELAESMDEAMSGLREKRREWPVLQLV